MRSKSPTGIARQYRLWPAVIHFSKCVGVPAKGVATKQNKALGYSEPDLNRLVSILVLQTADQAQFQSPEDIRPELGNKGIRQNGCALPASEDQRSGLLLRH